MPGEAFNGPIDAVYLWVNGRDRAFRERVRQFAPDATTAASCLFRDNGELRYSLRSLEKHAPWIRTIFIVTAGEVPDWLVPSRRCVLVNHRELFDEADLPLFSAPAIELGLHRIQGLSRFFLYMNDDLFLLQDVSLADFLQHGKETVRVTGEARELDVDGNVADASKVHTANAAAAVFGKAELGIPAHTPFYFDKARLGQMETLFGDLYRTAARNRFRARTDVALRTLYMASLLDSGSGVLREAMWGSEYRLIRVSRHLLTAARGFRLLFKSPPKFLCVNDELPSLAALFVFPIVRLLLRILFPLRSAYER